MLTEPELPNYRAKSFFGKVANGNNIYVYINRSERHGLYYKTKSPGVSWSRQKTFHFQNNRNSYPTLVEDLPGRWLSVCVSSNNMDSRRTAIRFGIVEVE